MSSVDVVRRRKSSAEVAVGVSLVSSSRIAEVFERLLAAVVVVVTGMSAVVVAGLLGARRPIMISAILADTSADPCCAFLRLSCS